MKLLRLVFVIALALGAHAARGDLLLEYAGPPLAVEVQELPNPGVTSITACIRLRMDRIPRSIVVQTTPSELGPVVSAWVSDGSRVFTHRDANWTMVFGSQDGLRTSINLNAHRETSGSASDSMGVGGVTFTQFFVGDYELGPQKRFLARARVRPSRAWRTTPIDAATPAESGPCYKVPKDSPPTSCPALEAMAKSTQELRALIDRLTRDDEFYDSVLMDLFLKGYDSDPVLAIDLPEDLLQPVFYDERSLREFRPLYIQRIRQRLDAREAIVAYGAKSSSGTLGDPPFGQDSQDYFCDLDPEKLTSGAWQALFYTGYIDIGTYNEDLWRRFVDSAFDEALASLLVAASWQVLPLRVAGRYLLALPATTRTIAIGAAQAHRLRSLIGRRFAGASFTPLGGVYTSVSAETLNRQVIELGLEKGEQWFGPWRTDRLVREVITKSDYRFIRVFVDNQTDPRGGWMIFAPRRDLIGLSPAEVGRRLGIPKGTPTRWAEITVPAGSRLRIGIAARIDGGPDPISLPGGGWQVEFVGDLSRIELGFSSNLPFSW